MPGRKYSNGSGYRYGFNGKELDKDITSDDYDFGSRIYDGRIGRWLSLDPLAIKFPNESHYCFVSNNPIFFMDAKGKFKIPYKKGTDEYKAALVVINAMKSEVDSWKDESDPRFQAFKQATGVQSIKFIKTELLKNNHGPKFVWGDSKTIKGKGDDEAHPTLLVANGKGFEKGSSYAITKGQEVIFDESIKSMALTIIDLESNKSIMQTNSYTFKSLDGSTFLVDDAKSEINKCLTFISHTGLHEGGHYLSGMAAAIKPKNGDPGTINYKDETGQDQSMDRGEFFERKAYGKALSHEDPESGVIPLMEINRRQRACDTGECFPTDKEKTDSYEKQEAALEIILNNRGIKKQ